MSCIWLVFELGSRLFLIYFLSCTFKLWCWFDLIPQFFMYSWIEKRYLNSTSIRNELKKTLLFFGERRPHWQGTKCWKSVFKTKLTWCRYCHYWIHKSGMCNAIHKLRYLFVLNLRLRTFVYVSNFLQLSLCSLLEVALNVADVLFDYRQKSSSHCQLKHVNRFKILGTLHRMTSIWDEVNSRLSPTLINPINT